MRNFLYRCPVTQLNVQGAAPESAADDGVYIPQSCPACGGVHIVDPLTGKGPESEKTGKSRIKPSYKLECRK